MASTKGSAKGPSAPARKPVAKSATTAAKKPALKVKGRSAAAAPAAAAKPHSRKAAKAPGVGAEQRRNYIEVAAYHIAERRGFAPGDPLADWVQAEAEIDRLLREGRLGQ
jgi:hypothetical protein